MTLIDSWYGKQSAALLFNTTNSKGLKSGGVMTTEESFPFLGAKDLAHMNYTITDYQVSLPLGLHDLSTKGYLLYLPNNKFILGWMSNELLPYLVNQSMLGETEYVFDVDCKQLLEESINRFLSPYDAERMFSTISKDYYSTAIIDFVVAVLVHFNYRVTYGTGNRVTVTWAHYVDKSTREEEKQD
ncbi:hypothetical protein GPK34_00270 [Secundilactobacillus kimchicus]|uniref:hypothetical protein n=1 Tax=Secundilactobacillus kimchicus TaxID=528209 RepID=UPI001C02B298|nr:hypothetical protein [Secundilactobacillus kimchicus]MBT9670471.1 hypothetical protein [Secundilactobacillus kimchicus]